MSYNTAGAENLSIMGFHGGATLRYQFLQRLSVQMDGMVSTMGNRQKVTMAPDEFTTIVTETKTNTMFLHVPIYVNFEKAIMPDNLVPYRVKRSSSSFHLYGGGFFGMALSANQEIQIKTTTPDGTTATPAVSGEIDPKTYNPIDFGIMAGLGMSFKMNEDDSKRLGLDARYLMGFSNFTKVKGATATNSAIQISVMFTQKLTKRRYTTRHRR